MEALGELIATAREAVVAARCDARLGKAAVIAADAAREATFPFLASESVDPRANEAYAATSILYAEAVLLLPAGAPIPEPDGDDGEAPAPAPASASAPAPRNTAARNAAVVLRAIDLAILRGGPEHALSSRSLNIRASKILDAERKKGKKERAAVSAADGTATTSHDRSKRRRVDPASTAPHGDSDSEAHCVHWTKGVQSGQLRAIPRVAAADLSPARFKTDYLATETPVIITGAIDDWPAMGGPARDGEREAGAEGARWDLDYLKLKAGDRLVPVELCDSSDRTQTYLTSSWERQVMNLRDYIDQYVIAPSTERGAGAHSGYLAQYALFNQIPTLREDIAVPRYCSETLIGDADAEPPTGAGSAEDSTLLSTDEVQVSAWFGPAGTVSPLHHDPYHNVFAQVVGRKYVRLYPKDQTDRLYQRRDHLCNNSWVDIDNVDGDRFPLFDAATGLHCELGPGDLLHIPRGCWHYLTSLDVSFSVSFWWGARA